MAEGGAPTRLKDLAEVVAQHGSAINRIEGSMETFMADIRNQLSNLVKQIRDDSTSHSPPKPKIIPSSPPLQQQGPYIQPQWGPKIDLQKYDGEGEPTGWIQQAKQYFLFYQIPPAQQLLIASFHLKGDALQYFQWLQHTGSLTDWGAFVQQLEKHFGQSDFDDPEGELAKLRQTSSVTAYQKQFEALSNRVVGLTDEFLLHCFMSGLKDEIRYMLNFFFFF